MKTKLCSLLLLMLISAQSYAAQQQVALIVELIDGTTQEYVIGVDPRVTFEGDNVVIKSQLAETELPKQQVERFYFNLPEDIPTAISDNKVAPAVSFSYDGCMVHVTGAGHSVQVYDLNGRLMCNAQCSDGTATIDMSGLNSGVYIVKTQSQTIKILKK